MMNLEIRRARREDVDAIVRFCALGAEETLSRELNEEDVRTGVMHTMRSVTDFFLVAKIGAEYVGQLKVHRHYYVWYDAFLWWIEHVYVSECHRRRGISQRLLDHAMNLAKEEEHVRGLILFVSKKNEIAMEAYSKFGFMAPELKLMFFDNGRV